MFSELRVLPVSLLAVRKEEGRVKEIRICGLCIILLLIGTQWLSTFSQQPATGWVRTPALCSPLSPPTSVKLCRAQCVWYGYLAWCQALVSNSSPGLSGRDDNRAAIGAEPKWLCRVVTEPAARGSPEVGLIMSSLTPSAAGLLLLCKEMLPKGNKYSLLAWVVKGASVKKEEKYWN